MIVLKRQNDFDENTGKPNYTIQFKCQNESCSENRLFVILNCNHIGGSWSGRCSKCGHNYLGGLCG